jgi:hypothetical protein
MIRYPSELDPADLLPEYKFIFEERALASYTKTEDCPFKSIEIDGKIEIREPSTIPLSDLRVSTTKEKGTNWYITTG